MNFSAFFYISCLETSIVFQASGPVQVERATRKEAFNHLYERRPPTCYKVTKRLYKKKNLKHYSSSSLQVKHSCPWQNSPNCPVSFISYETRNTHSWVLQPSHLFHTTYLKDEEIKTIKRTLHLWIIWQPWETEILQHLIPITHQMKSGFFSYNPKIIA